MTDGQEAAAELETGARQVAAVHTTRIKRLICGEIKTQDPVRGQQPLSNDDFEYRQRTGQDRSNKGDGKGSREMSA